jgi:hypothetical protein
MQSYKTGVIAWSNEQAAFIRSGRFDLLDLEYIADEIEDVGKSWERSIKDQRTMIMRRLSKTPGLKPELEP